MFQELAAHGEHDDSRQKTTNELIKAINKYESIAKLIDLMYSLKITYVEDKQDKSICILNQKEKNNADPLVNLQIEGYHVLQIVLNFGS